MIVLFVEQRRHDHSAEIHQIQAAQQADAQRIVDEYNADMARIRTAMDVCQSFPSI